MREIYAAIQLQAKTMELLRMLATVRRHRQSLVLASLGQSRPMQEQSNIEFQNREREPLEALHDFVDHPLNGLCLHLHSVPISVYGLNFVIHFCCSGSHHLQETQDIILSSLVSIFHRLSKFSNGA